MDKPYIIEYCTDNLQDAISNQHLYDQLEYCSDLNLEGLTPSVEDVKFLLANCTKRLKVMIRSFEPNFEHNEENFDAMCAEAKSMYELGVRNFVFGTLNKGRLNFYHLNRFSSVVPEAKICIHKAIDNSTNILEDTIELNERVQVDEILSSGGDDTALEGKETLLQMQALFKGTVIAAGKITKDNLGEINEQLRLRAYHGRKIV